MSFDGVSIKKLSARAHSQAQRFSQRETDRRGGQVFLETAVITGGSAGAGYAISLIDRDGSVSSDTYSAVFTFPGAQVFEVGNRVLLMFLDTMEFPVILATGGGSGGDAVPVIVSKVGFHG